MVIGLLLCLAQAVAGAGEPASQRYAGSELVVRTYLVLPAVDARGRRPFRPDAVLARYLVKPGSPSPRAGESVKGETGEAAWSERTAAEDGRVGGAAWAHARVESEVACVVLARLEGASTLFVNGEPFAGDLYGYGFGGVPVALRAGANELHVNGMRGAFRLSLVPCEPGVLFGPWDLTLPTQTVGEPSRWLSGILLLNASEQPAEVTLEAWDAERGRVQQATPFRLAALGVRKVALAPSLESRFDAAGTAELTLRMRQAGREGERTLQVSYAVRTPDEVGVRTFFSSIDESVQKYAVRRPAPGGDRETPLRLLVSLHGAGVDCEGQAASYAPKQDFWIVAPTNRRPFGFDWQDWGRRDVYEALELAMRPFPSATPVYLSGHSMGGHGTWHLAANDPDRFAAVAPSAGWRSFDTYGGRPEGARAALWRAADGASRTEDLLENLASIPTYVLHGEADDNVPASEGHAMVAALEAAGAKPRSHFEPGAGHWWDDASGAPGAACVDWPGIFELFRSTWTWPTPPSPREFSWTGVDPGVDSRHHWVSVEQLLRYGACFRVQARYDQAAARLVLTTDNVRCLGLARPQGWEEGWRVDAFELDGQTLPPDFEALYTRGQEGWSAAPRATTDLVRVKSAYRCGPLKRAFERGFVLVVPTKGSAEENAAALARARYDAGVWWYRGNGDTRIFTDEEYRTHGPPRRSLEGDHRNVILYGNADTNSAFAFLPEEFPLQVRRGRVRLGAEEWSGDALGALALGSVDMVLFAVLGSSGPEADRIAASLSLFVSGVGYPDYVVYGPEVLAQGDGGVRAAGFFDHRWQLPEEKAALGR